MIDKGSRGIPNIHINKCEFPKRGCFNACSSSVSTFQNHTGMLRKLLLFHSGAGTLTSPLWVSDNFLNEAHYVFIDFSYSLLRGKYPQGTPLPPCPPTYSSSFSLFICTIYLSIQVFIRCSPKDCKTAEHLREANRFQLAKQIPPLTLTWSHGASESLAGHYRQLDFNKANMLTVQMEKVG